MTRPKYLAFDIETAKILPEEVEDLKSHRPLGICCAAVVAEDEGEPHLWYTCHSKSKPTAQMSRDDLCQLVHFLQIKTAAGYTIFTWNGLGFDFDILAEESGMLEQCRKLAIDHVDMMFHVLCEKGFPVSLEAAAKGFRVRGKMSGMTGVMAPQLWAQGKVKQVLGYVAQDCRIVLEVARAGERSHEFVWVTRRGSRSRFGLPSGWLTVSDAMKLPKPDTSWMSSPKSRESFLQWPR